MKKVVLNSSDYISRSAKWSGELTVLIDLLKSTELKEEIKWGIPVFCYNNKNVIAVVRFHDFLSLWFYQGVFLKDTHRLLHNGQDEKIGGLRQIRFKSVRSIDVKVMKEYILEAIENQKQGKEIGKLKAKELA